MIAAVLALAAIGYGYYRDYRERQIEAEWAAPARAGSGIRFRRVTAAPNPNIIRTQ